ncbi:MAG: transposase [Candidatus Melainabacteria bacterium HGW-Melainabacteria-1]|nr:MAG: transposase [Candidatus Melainabacteria bacterium HGW-Melainabacteria-1]
MRKTYRYRLYPTKAQAQALEQQLREGCNLYNAALQERRDAWQKTGASIRYTDQSAQLKTIRAEGLNNLANFSCCQDILRRVDKTYQAFFRRVKRGEKAGYPRFKPHQRFDSITFPSYGDGIRLLPSGKLRVQDVGAIKVKLHRPVEGHIKTVTIKREAGKWYVCFSVIAATYRLKFTPKAVGIDVGLESFAVLSDGTVIANPRQYRKAQARLRRAQRKVARRKKGSHRRKKAVRELQAAHAHVRNQRQDFHHKLSHRLVQNYGIIAIEDLNIQGLAGGMLAKSVHDAGWSGFFSKLTYKAESAGRLLLRVDPRGTSQRCSGCSAEGRKALKDRWHHCLSCGFSVSRDLNSANEILRLGLSLVDSTWGISPCVSTEAVCFS